MSTRANLPSFSDATQGEVVTIKIGPTAQYCVHKSLVSPVSAYFERAFIDGVEFTLGGDETDVEFFNVFIDWLYSGKVPVNINRIGMPKAVVFGHFITAPRIRSCSAQQPRRCLDCGA